MNEVLKYLSNACKLFCEDNVNRWIGKTSENKHILLVGSEKILYSVEDWKVDLGEAARKVN